MKTEVKRKPKHEKINNPSKKNKKKKTLQKKKQSQKMETWRERSMMNYRKILIQYVFVLLLRCLLTYLWVCVSVCVQWHVRYEVAATNDHVFICYDEENPWRDAHVRILLFLLHLFCFVQPSIMAALFWNLTSLLSLRHAY